MDILQRLDQLENRISIMEQQIITTPPTTPTHKRSRAEENEENPIQVLLVDETYSDPPLNLKAMSSQLNRKNIGGTNVVYPRDLQHVIQHATFSQDQRRLVLHKKYLPSHWNVARGLHICIHCGLCETNKHFKSSHGCDARMNAMYILIRTFDSETNLFTIPSGPRCFVMLQKW